MIFGNRYNLHLCRCVVEVRWLDTAFTDFVRRTILRTAAVAKPSRSTQIFKGLTNLRWLSGFLAAAAGPLDTAAVLSRGWAVQFRDGCKVEGLKPAQLVDCTCRAGCYRFHFRTSRGVEGLLIGSCLAVFKKKAAALHIMRRFCAIPRPFSAGLLPARCGVTWYERNHLLCLCEN
jgi:hypothetical protein